MENKSKKFTESLKNYFNIEDIHVFLIENILIFLVSLLIVLWIYYYDFFINSLFWNLISIFMTISIVVFIKKKLVNNKNNNTLDELDTNDKIDYYKEQISSRVNTFNLLWLTVAIITYFATFYVMDIIRGKEKLEWKEADFYFWLFMIFLVWITFFIFLFNILKYHSKINQEILDKKVN